LAYSLHTVTGTLKVLIVLMFHVFEYLTCLSGYSLCLRS